MSIFDSALALVSLAALEIILGVDNIVFIAILVGKLPEAERKVTRQIGLVAAMVMRILLLLCITWVMGLTRPLFAFAGHAMSARDIILLLGGLFLVAKATYEIHEKLESTPHVSETPKKPANKVSIIIQIMILDIIFSLDSVITAIGVASELWVMVTAIVLAVGVMLIFAGKVSKFIEVHPTLKMLALSFLILIGVMLVSEGLGKHIDKGYIYFAMGYALLVEALNIRMSKKRKAKALPA